MNRNVFLVFALFLLFSCVPEKPTTENKVDKFLDSLHTKMEKDSIEMDSTKKVYKAYSANFRQSLFLYKEDKERYISELDSLENNKILPADSIKRFRQAITLFDLAACDEVYIEESFFIVTKKNGSGRLDGLYSLDGKEICKSIYTIIDPSSFEPLILIAGSNSKDAFLNQKGEVVLSDFIPFMEEPDEKNYVILEKDTKWGAYNVKTGQMIIAPTFDSLGLFEKEKALAVKNGERFYIDRKGNKTSPPNF